MFSKWTLLTSILACTACGRLGYDVSEVGGEPTDAAPADAAPADAAGPDGTADADAAAADAAADASLPFGMTFVDPSATMQVGGSGGSAFADMCPAGQVVTGFDGALYAADDLIGRIRAHCGLVEVDPDSLAVTILPATDLPEHGTGTTSPWTSACPADQVVVGHGGRSGLLVDQLIFYCAPLVISGSAGNHTVGLGATTALPAVGHVGGSVFADQICTDGRVTAAYAGRSGTALDAFSLVCSRPTVAF